MTSLTVDVEQHSYCLETLANQLRLDIIRLLDEKPMNVTKIAAATRAERSRVSHSLQILRRCNLVKTEKQGREIIYMINTATPLFKQHKGDVFSIIEEHARYCTDCPRLKHRGQHV